jgi:hypothetical protein
VTDGGVLHPLDISDVVDVPMYVYYFSRDFDLQTENGVHAFKGSYGMQSNYL